MKKRHIADGQKIVVVLLFMADYLFLVLAEHTALYFQGLFRVQASSVMVMPWDYQYIYIPGLFLLIFLLAGCYCLNRPSLALARDVFRGICFGFLIYVLVIFLMRNSMQVSRYYAGCFLLLSLLYVAAGRYIWGKILHGIDCLKEDVLLIGAGKTAERLLSAFTKDVCYFYRIIGMVDDHPISHDLPRKYPVLGGLSDAAAIVRLQNVRTVIITAPGMSEKSIRSLLIDLQHVTDTILFTPGLVETPLGNVEINTLFVEQLALIKSKNNLSRWYNRAIKFTFDMILTAMGLLLISPLFILLALLVCFDNKGHVFFAHTRVGRQGREFPCYKFRTMLPDAEKMLIKHLKENPEARREWEENFKLSDDPRVTRLGAFLRKTSLDELPQLFNVLRGEMSLVGPRPIVQAEVEKYGENIREYFLVRPGITGMWQTSGRSDTTYEERVQMDTWYVRNWSVWIDIKYLLKTVGAVINRQGAY